MHQVNEALEKLASKIEKMTIHEYELLFEEIKNEPIYVTMLNPQIEISISEEKIIDFDDQALTFAFYRSKINQERNQIKSIQGALQNNTYSIECCSAS